MDIEQALHDLGVRADTLTKAQKAALDTDGYVKLPGILTPDQTARMGARLAELVELEGEDAGIEVHKETGTDRLGDLVNKDPLFDVCFTHPRLLACVHRIINADFSLGALNARNPHPGYGHQGFHADSAKAVKTDAFEYVNSIWLMVDFTDENGPTRIVPGSHRWEKLPKDAMANPEDPHPEEITLTGKAGTVIVFNAHLWHAGTTNKSSEHRWAAFAYFGRHDVPQYVDQRKYMRPETYARLSEAARHILGVSGMTEFSPPDMNRKRVPTAYA